MQDYIMFFLTNVMRNDLISACLGYCMASLLVDLENNNNPII